METLASNKWYEIKLDRANNLIEIAWKSAIIELSEEEYKKMLIDVYSKLPEYNVDKLLQNTSDTVYPITPELQEWITQNISKPYLENGGIKKVAYIIPREFLTKLGVEQLVEKAQQETPSVVRYFFASYDKAREWLLS